LSPKLTTLLPVWTRVIVRVFYRLSAMLLAMDDAAATCDAGVSSSQRRNYDDGDQQLQQQLIHNAAMYSDWTTSSADQQHHTHRRPSCSYTQQTLTAADSTTAGPSATDDALLSKTCVRFLCTESYPNFIRGWRMEHQGCGVWEGVCLSF